MSNTDDQIRFAVVGDNCVDLLGPPINRNLVGGNAVNVAIQLALLGQSVIYFGAIGPDENGKLVKRALERNGVDTSGLVVRSELPTAVTEIEFDAEGDRIIGFEDFGACDGYAPDDDAVDLLATMDHVHVGWLNDGGALRSELAARGTSVSQDISVNAAPKDIAVAGLEYAFASLPGTREAASDLARSLVHDGAKSAIVTRGNEGSLAFVESERIFQASWPIAPVDTTGAGDSFIAGFLSGRMEGHSVAEALQTATRLAARTCGHAGGFPQD